MGVLSWLSICGGAETASRARELCIKHCPDLIVLDAEIAGGESLSLLKDFSRLHPTARTLVLGEREDAPWLQRVFRAGASGYVSKWDAESELANGLMQLAMHKDRFVSGRMSRIVMKQLMDELCPKLPTLPVETLSNRELEVYCLAGKGKGANATASGLGISVKTVETHYHRIKIKLGLQTGEELRRTAGEWLAGDGYKKSKGQKSLSRFPKATIGD